MPLDYCFLGKVLNLLINVIAILVLLMVPLVPVGLVLIVVGLVGKRVRVSVRCPACQHLTPETSVNAAPLCYCTTCGSALPPVIQAGPVHRERNRYLLISGVVMVTAIPAIALCLFIVGVVRGAANAMTAGATTPPTIANASGVASPSAQPQPIAQVMPRASLTTPEIGRTAVETMARFNSALIEGDERTMVACFAASDAEGGRAIAVGVALKAATVRLAGETVQRFGSEEEKAAHIESIDEINRRWANATFTQNGAEGILAPAPGKKNLVPRHFVETTAGWRLDPNAAIRQNILGMSGGLTLDQEKTARLQAILAKLRDGQYASRAQVNEAWQEAQAEAGRRDMDRIIRAINATTSPVTDVAKAPSKR